MEEDELYLQMISNMNSCELLSEVIRNPEYLIDVYYASVAMVVLSRARELGVVI